MSTYLAHKQRYEKLHERKQAIGHHETNLKIKNDCQMGIIRATFAYSVNLGQFVHMYGVNNIYPSGHPNLDTILGNLTNNPQGLISGLDYTEKGIAKTIGIIDALTTYCLGHVSGRDLTEFLPKLSGYLDKMDAILSEMDTPPPLTDAELRLKSDFLTRIPRWINLMDCGDAGNVDDLVAKYIHIMAWITPADLKSAITEVIRQNNEVGC